MPKREVSYERTEVRERQRTEVRDQRSEADLM
jgi:hypothetical protein